MYTFYQLARNNEVYNIRCKWADEDDRRRRDYTYDEMFDLSPKNLYGLKWPKESDFK